MDLKILNRLLGTGLFILSFLWFYFPAEYVLIANRDIRIFITTLDYLSSFLERPGGLLEYAGSFLNQFLRFRVVGALLLAGVITMSYFVAGEVVIRISGKRKFLIVGLVTPALLVGMHHYYSHQLYHSLGLILSVYMVVRVPSNRVKRRYTLAIGVPLLYLVCGGYIWLFAGLLLAMDYAKNRRIDPELILLTTVYPVMVTLIGAKLIFLYPVNELFAASFPFGQQYGTSFIPVIFIVWILFLVVLTSLEVHWKVMKNSRICILETIVGMAGIFLIMNFTYHRKNAEFFTIEKFAVQEEWDELLSYAALHPSMNLFGSFYTNLALANKGKLCAQLFHYPQPFGRRGLCFGWEAKGEILRRGSDFFWTISFVNEAHHWAFESMIIDGFTRRNLTRLIQTELVRGNYKVAEMYIHIIERTLFDKQIADHYRRFLYNREAIEKDAELGPKIISGVGEDFFTDGLDLEKNLRSLLIHNWSNRHAMDYLLALFLLEKEVDQIKAFLPRYLDLSNGRIPELLDESLLVYRITHPDDTISNLMVSPGTIERFEAYTRVLRQARDQNEAARILYPAYKNSFWYYLNFTSTEKSRQR